MLLLLPHRQVFVCTVTTLESICQKSFHTGMYLSVLLPHWQVNVSTVTSLASICLNCYRTDKSSLQCYSVLSDIWVKIELCIPLEPESSVISTGNVLFAYLLSVSLNSLCFSVLSTKS